MAVNPNYEPVRRYSGINLATAFFLGLGIGVWIALGILLFAK